MSQPETNRLQGMGLEFRRSRNAVFVEGPALANVEGFTSGPQSMKDAHALASFKHNLDHGWRRVAFQQEIVRR